jgi:hypothetical protein
MKRARGILVLAFLGLVSPTATAEPMAGTGMAAVELVILDEKGAPVFCTHNTTGGRGQPDAGGGYRLIGLRPGKWVVTLDLPHERVDILVTANEGETVVVPPVIARGFCRSIALTRRLDLRRLVEAPPATWAVRYDRTYRSQRGPVATGYRFEGTKRLPRPRLDR